MTVTTSGALSRRSALTGLVATANVPVWTQSLPSSSDVVIIGDGSVGLPAARFLIAMGRPVVIVVVHMLSKPCPMRDLS